MPDHNFTAGDAHAASEQHAQPSHTPVAILTSLREDLTRAIAHVHGIAPTLDHAKGGGSVSQALTHLEDAKTHIGQALHELGHPQHDAPKQP